MQLGSRSGMPARRALTAVLPRSRRRMFSGFKSQWHTLSLLAGAEGKRGVQGGKRGIKHAATGACHEPALLAQLRPAHRRPPCGAMHLSRKRSVTSTCCATRRTTARLLPCSMAQSCKVTDRSRFSKRQGLLQPGERGVAHSSTLPSCPPLQLPLAELARAATGPVVPTVGVPTNLPGSCRP